MNTPRLVLLWLLLGLLATPLMARGYVRIPNGPVERLEVVKQVQGSLDRADFAALDALATEWWKTSARFSDGTWKLSAFFYVMVPKRAKTDPWTWPDRIALFERWQAALPASAVPRTLIARAWVAYAWEARGGGFSDTVTADGWRLMEERLGKARAFLKENESVVKGHPGYYWTLFTVALGQGWSKREAQALHAEAKRAVPGFFDFDFARANFLLPKWYGERPNEWHAFARSLVGDPATDDGWEAYTRAVWATAGPGTKSTPTARESGAAWADLQRGFEVIMARYPGCAWNLNVYAYYAVQFEDRATARRLFTELAGRCATTPWGTLNGFREAEAWANAEPAGQP